MIYSITLRHRITVVIWNKNRQGEMLPSFLPNATCLGDVLALEGWDPATLAMPEGLRQLRDDLLG